MYRPHIFGEHFQRIGRTNALAQSETNAGFVDDLYHTGGKLGIGKADGTYMQLPLPSSGQFYISKHRDQDPFLHFGLGAPTFHS